MLHRIQWPSAKAVGLIILFSVLYGLINTMLVSCIRNPVYNFQILAYLSLLTAIIEWYLIKYYLDTNVAKRMFISNLVLVSLFALTIYLFLVAPQVLSYNGPGAPKKPSNPFIGLTIFIAQIKYACLLFPLRYNKKHVKPKPSRL